MTFMARIARHLGEAMGHFWPRPLTLRRSPKKMNEQRKPAGMRHGDWFEALVDLGFMIRISAAG